MIILGIDPGVTTGFVRAEFGSTIENISAQVGEWRGMDELERLIKRGLFADVDTIIIERYLIYPNRVQSHIGDDLYTAQEIGRIKWIAFTLSINVIEQTASMAKQRWPNKRIKDTFQHTPTTTHILDAFRHVLTYIERRMEGKK